MGQATFLTDRDSATVEISVEQSVVAVALRGPLQAAVVAALAGAELMAVSDIGVASAAVVIADVSGNVREGVAALRRRARADAALIVVVPVASPELVRQALEAGAVVCLRPPIVLEELVAATRSALDTRAAKSRAADLARKLDLETHLASIGRMSAGLSHEISTPLHVASTNLAIVRDELGRTPQDPLAIEDALTEMQHAHDRLRDVLEMMRELVGRRRALTLVRVELRCLAEETKSLVVKDLEGVELEIVGKPTFGMADPLLLAQVIQNLVLNAAHAARALPAPRVRVHVYEHDGRAIVSVRDNGPGISPELHQKIFEPFYTTRRARGGTGLGLALCREYALQMNADLALWSVPGRGSCFRVLLQTE